MADMNTFDQAKSPVDPQPAREAQEAVAGLHPSYQGAWRWTAKGDGTRFARLSGERLFVGGDVVEVKPLYEALALTELAKLEAEGERARKAAVEAERQLIDTMINAAGLQAHDSGNQEVEDAILGLKIAIEAFRARADQAGEQAR